MTDKKRYTGDLLKRWLHEGQHIYTMRRLNYALFAIGMIAQVWILGPRVTLWVLVPTLLATFVASLHLVVKLDGPVFAKLWRDTFGYRMPSTVFVVVDDDEMRKQEKDAIDAALRDLNRPAQRGNREDMIQ